MTRRTTIRRVLRTAGAATVTTGLAVGVAACADDGPGQEEGTIRVATSPGPYSELFREGVAPIVEEDGYTVEFDDYTELQQADIALQEGSADLNVDQHIAYMENFNREAGADLASVTPVPTVPAGLFSSRHDSLDEIADGQSVSIPEDPSNASRAYRLLVKAGWLTVKDGTDEADIAADDIEDNPHDLDIRLVDSAFISRAIDDVDWAVIPGSMSYASGIDTDLQLLQEDLLPELVLQAVTQQDQVGSDWADAVADAYRSDEFADYLAGRDEDDYWVVPEELQ
ncbi:MetQ/NlpA family ABC transporter substrate-binding protein [Corynebacterium sp. USCH3]|uniref:MetQ/NlpA family ABC transporter substrate-binding protein n=1 Tax=Corynebacterium sp. USCH3 TaxID=3024840 RepID=UPI0030B4342C